MKRWLVLRSYAMLERSEQTNAQLLQDGVSLCKFITLDGTKLRVKWSASVEAVTFSDFNTGETYYILYKDGVDYLSDWSMVTCTDIAII